MRSDFVLKKSPKGFINIVCDGRGIYRSMRFSSFSSTIAELVTFMSMLKDGDSVILSCVSSSRVRRCG
jgi:hypothetical protein